MKLKLDENLGQRGKHILLDAAHEVASVADQGLTTAEDSVLIEVCRQEGRCLVTMDMDFANPFLFPPANYPGIAVLKLPRRPSSADLLAAIRTLRNGLEKDTVSGRLWIVQRHRIRVYSPD